MAMASSLDQIGPITKNVRDAANVLSVIAGPDTFDSTTAPRDVPNYLDATEQSVDGLRVGVPDEYFGEGLSGLGRFIAGIGDGLQYRIEEKEVKEVRHE
jgi:aspartyl-tRNA(Asn)/glutamyl-tRNA(Gln) amidotransferase subunit A